MTVETGPHAEEKLYTRYRKLATLQRETLTKIDRLKDHREFISNKRFSDLLAENEKVLAELTARLAPLTARLEAVLCSRKLDVRSVEAELVPLEKKIQEARVLHKINLISWRQLHREIKRVRPQRNRLFKTLKTKRREINRVQALLDMRDPGEGRRRPPQSPPPVGRCRNSGPKRGPCGGFWRICAERKSRPLSRPHPFAGRRQPSKSSWRRFKTAIHAP